MLEPIGGSNREFPEIILKLMADKHVLITGGTGYLGSQLAKALVSRQFRVTVLKRPLSNTDRLLEIADQIDYLDLGSPQMEACFAERKVDCVLHCATHYGRNETRRKSILDANLLLPLELLELAIEHGVSAFINIDTSLGKESNAYSLSKHQFKEWLKRAAGIRALNLPLAYFFGPGDDPWKFITFVISELLKGATKIDLSPGEQKRDFFFIEDAVDAILTIIGRIESFSVGFHNLPIGSGQAVQLKDLVLIIARLVGNRGTNLNFGGLNYRKNEVMEQITDLSAMTQLGWNPSWALEQGLAETIRFERKQLNGEI